MENATIYEQLIIVILIITFLTDKIDKQILKTHVIQTLYNFFFKYNRSTLRLTSNKLLFENPLLTIYYVYTCTRQAFRQSNEKLTYAYNHLPIHHKTFDDHPK